MTVAETGKLRQALDLAMKGGVRQAPNGVREGFPVLYTAKPLRPPRPGSREGLAEDSMTNARSEELRAKHSHYLITSWLHPAAVAGAFHSGGHVLLDAGIPVIAIDIPHPGATHFRANNYEGG